MEYAEAKRLGLKKYNTGRPCRNGHTVDRFTSSRSCTRCQYEALSKWVRNNPNRHREQGREWKRRNLDRYHTEPERAKMREHWRAKHGFPTPTRPLPKKCECCSNTLEPGRKTHLDHCHDSGKFRGWICNRCNLGIGILGDTIEGLQRAIEYLKRAEN